MGYEKEKLTNHIVLWNILPSADLVEPYFKYINFLCAFCAIESAPTPCNPLNE